MACLMPSMAALVRRGRFIGLLYKCGYGHRQRDDPFVGSCEEDTTSLSSPCSSDQVPARGEAQTTPRAFCCEFQSAVVMSSPRRTSSQLHLTEAAPRPRERQCWSESSCGGRVFALTCGTLR